MGEEPDWPMGGRGVWAGLSAPQDPHVGKQHSWLDLPAAFPPFAPRDPEPPIRP